MRARVGSLRWGAIACLALSACKAEPRESRADANSAPDLEYGPRVSLLEDGAPAEPGNFPDASGASLDAGAARVWDLLEGSKADKARVERQLGLYRITHYTESVGRCEVEGPSVLERRSELLFMLIYRENGLAQPTLESCRTREHCSKRAAFIRNGGGRLDEESELWYAFGRVKGHRLTGDTVSTGGCVDGKCTGAFYGPTSLDLGDDEVRFEMRRAEFDYKTTGSYANTREAKEHAASKPCTRHVVVRGSRLGPL